MVMHRTHSASIELPLAGYVLCAVDLDDELVRHCVPERRRPGEVRGRELSTESDAGSCEKAKENRSHSRSHTERRRRQAKEELHLVGFESICQMSKERFIVVQARSLPLWPPRSLLTETIVVCRSIPEKRRANLRSRPGAHGRVRESAISEAGDPRGRGS